MFKLIFVNSLLTLSVLFKWQWTKAYSVFKLYTDSLYNILLLLPKWNLQCKLCGKMLFNFLLLCFNLVLIILLSKTTKYLVPQRSPLTMDFNQTYRDILCKTFTSHPLIVAVCWPGPYSTLFANHLLHATANNEWISLKHRAGKGRQYVSVVPF